VERRALRFLALFLALAGAYVVLEVVVAPRRERARRLEERIFPFDAAEVAEIHLASGASVAFEDGGPRLRAPVDAPVDPAAVGALLDRVLAARWGRRLSVPAESLAAYGLDPPRGSATVRARDGRSVTLAFGAETPAGKSVYLRDAAGAGRVGVGAEFIARVLSEGAETLRDRRLVAPNAGALWAVRVERPRGALVLAREGPGAWRIVAPIAARAGREHIATLLSRVLGARAARFLDAAGDSAARASALTASSAYRVVLSGGGFEDTLAFGMPRPEDGSIVATGPLQPCPVLVDPSLREILDIDAASLREERLFRRAPAEAAAVALSLGADALVLERDATRADAWRIVSPESLDADPTRVRALLRNLDITRIARWADDAPASAAGLDPPRARVALRFADPPSRETLLLGLPTPDGGAYAAWEAESEIIVTSEALLDVITPDPAAYEKRRFLEDRIEASHLITMTYQRGHLVLTRPKFRREGGGWRGTESGATFEGSQRPEQPNRRLGMAGSENWVSRLRSLEYLDRLPPAVGDSVFGFAEPFFVIEWDGPFAGRLEIGTQIGPSQRLARLSGRRWVYVLDTAGIDSLGPAQGN